MALELKREINIGHIFMGVALIGTLITTQFTNEKRDARIEAKSELHSAIVEAEFARISGVQAQLLAELKALRQDHNALLLQFSRHVSKDE